MSYWKNTNEGIIAPSACLGGEIGDALKEQSGTTKRARLQSGINRSLETAVIEIQDHVPTRCRITRSRNGERSGLGKELDISVALTCDAPQNTPTKDTRTILLCGHRLSTLSDENACRSRSLSARHSAGIRLVGGKDQRSLLNTAAIGGKRCNLSWTLGKILIQSSARGPENRI